MGFRFRKSVKIAPGVRLNFGKKSTSVSLGGKGARYTISSTGRKTASVGVPGTGISYVETVSGKKSKKVDGKVKSKKENKSIKQIKCKSCGASIPQNSKVCPACGAKVKKPIYKKWYFWLILIVVLGALAPSNDTEKPDQDQDPPAISEQVSNENLNAESSGQEQTPKEEPIQEEKPIEEEQIKEEPKDFQTEEPAIKNDIQKEEPVAEPTEPVQTKPAESTSPTVATPPVAEEPKQTETQPETKSEPVGVDYVLNTNKDSLKFHYPSCPSVSRMKESNKKYFTGTRDEVIAMGYTPCGKCNP